MQQRGRWCAAAAAGAALLALALASAASAAECDARWLERQGSWKVVTASDEDNGNLKEFALDGKADTFWEGDDNVDEWVIVDLGKEYTVERIRLQKGQKSIRNYEVRKVKNGAGDNAELLLAYKADNLRLNEERRFDAGPTKMRFLQIFIEDTYYRNAQINEIELFGFDAADAGCATADSRPVPERTGKWQSLKMFEGREDYLKRPDGLAVHPLDGRVFVANEAAHEVIAFDLDRNTIDLVVNEYAGLSAPEELALSKDGRYLFISDDDASAVFRVDLTGPVPAGQQAFTELVGRAEGFDSPEGIAIHPDTDVLFIADEKDHSVKVRGVDGAVTLLADAGDGVGAPEGMAVSAAGELFYADDRNGGVYKVTAGKVEAVLSKEDVPSPEGIGLDAAGNMWVTVNSKSPPVAQKWSAGGKLLEEVVVDAELPRGSLAGLALLADGRVAVAASWRAKDRTRHDFIYQLVPPTSYEPAPGAGGAWAEWGDFATCLPACGEGRRQCRYRACEGGASCAGASFACQDCAEEPCSTRCNNRWLEKRNAWTVGGQTTTKPNLDTYAFDSDPTTYWESGSSSDYLWIDLGEVYRLERFELQPLAGGIREVEVQTSVADGKLPKTVGTYTVPDGGGDGDESGFFVAKFPATESRYWRIDVKSTYSGRVRLRELSPFGDRAGCSDGLDPAGHEVPVVEEPLPTGGFYTSAGTLYPSREFRIKVLFTEDDGLDEPEGLGLDKDGNVLVANLDDAEILKLDAKTKKLSTFVKKGDLDIDEPLHVSMDGDGFLWVVDKEKAVYKYDVARERKEEIKGGDFKAPNALGLGADGTVFVGDESGGHPGVYAYEGDSKDLVRLSKEPETPEGIAVARDGRVYVTDEDRGVFRMTKGDDGKWKTERFLDNDDAEDPESIFADADGSVWVMVNGKDNALSMVRHFTPGGELLEDIPITAGGTKFKGKGVVVLADGSVVMSGYQGSKAMLLLATPSRFPFGSRSAVDPDPDPDSEPAGGGDSDDDSDDGGGSGGGGGGSSEAASGGVGPDTKWTIKLLDDDDEFLNGPDGATLSPDGLFVIANEDGGNVLFYDRDRERYTEAVPRKAGLDDPEEVAVEENGDIWVTDDGHGAVFRWKNGELEKVFDDKDGLVSPEGVAVSDTGFVYVADEKAHLVFRVEGDKEKTSSLKLVEVGNDDDGVRYPEGMAVDSDGSLYMTDDKKGGVLRYKNGKWDTFISARVLESPEGIFIDSVGTFWVTDNVKPAVLHFDGEGRLIQEQEIDAVPPGGLAGLAVLPDFRVLVIAKWYKNKGTKDEERQFQLYEMKPDLVLAPPKGTTLQFLAQPLHEEEINDGLLNQARGIAVSPATGRFYVANYRGSSIIAIDVNQGTIAEVDDGFTRPQDVTVRWNAAARRDELFVADDRAVEVRHLTLERDGSVDDNDGYLDRDNGLENPDCIAYTDDGYVWFGDEGARKIWRVKVGEKKLETMTWPSSKLHTPNAMAADRDGSSILVTNGRNGGIYRVTDEGAIFNIVHKSKIRKPTGVSVDRKTGDVWAINNDGNEPLLMQYTSEGEPINKFALGDIAPKNSVWGLAIDDELRMLLGITYKKNGKRVSEVWGLEKVGGTEINTGSDGDSDRAVIIGASAAAGAVVIIAGVGFGMSRRKKKAAADGRASDAQAVTKGANGTDVPMDDLYADVGAGATPASRSSAAQPQLKRQSSIV